MVNSALKKALVATSLRAMLALFLVPVITAVFAHFLLQNATSEIRTEIDREITASTKMSSEQKQAARAYYGTLTPASACFSDAPELQSYRDSVCETFSSVWQFVVVERLAVGTIVGNAVLLLVLVALGFLAFANRSAQYASFVFGWRLLTVASALEIVLQGVFAVWLSYWVTAHFFHMYVPKLIIIVALLAAAAVFAALVALFRRIKSDNALDGVLLAPAQAPALWARLRDFAAKLGTAPPAQIVAGIDANFFVTETPVRVGDQVLKGRTLFVSLPLLRQLETDEANAVLAHELGHFAGGDTANSAALGPKLTHYDAYTAQMRTGGATIIAYFLLHLYRLILETALQKASREREFAADHVAARLTSPQAVVRALIKVAAYATYRGRVQSHLFEQRERHEGDLGIASRVAQGLAAFGQSAEFAEAMRAANVPHPFDSHPPLPQRMENVGYALPEAQFAAIVCAPATATWVGDIVDADAVEQTQWQAYERQFAAAHEETLAYRYVPATDAERAHVLRYFPDANVPTKDGAVVITYAGVQFPGRPEMLSWDRVKTVRYEDASLGADALTVEHPEKGWLGAKSTKFKLRFAKGDRDTFKQVFSHYWRRHQIMRSQAPLAES